LLEKGWLAKRALVYIEMEKEAALPILPAHWSLMKEKNKRDSWFTVYLKSSNNPIKALINAGLALLHFLI